jgi:thioesterase domain-containing protein
MAFEGSDNPLLSETQLERYLHGTIPLSSAMGVRVKLASPERVRLWAPLAPNVNHAVTVFGGSAAAVATLSAWTLLHLRLEHVRSDARLVIQRSAMEYEKPIPGDFDAICSFSDESAWERFSATLDRRGRARLTLTAELLHSGLKMASFEGDFVALQAV